MSLNNEIHYGGAPSARHKINVAPVFNIPYIRNETTASNYRDVVFIECNISYIWVIYYHE